MTSTLAARGVRRLITVDGPDGRSYVLDDARVTDVLLDPARPGFSSTRVWATDRSPAIALARESIERMAASLQPPAGGAVFRVVVVPPDAGWIGKVSPDDVRAYFAAAGSPDASRHAPDAPHPYMQQTRTLDLCVVLEGRPTLVLDRDEVTLEVSDTVVLRGTRHAWSNRSSQPAVIAISSHDADRPRR